jgi:hypothetical protein
MVAAIYARKSNDQSDVADNVKSVSRQIEHAREYAARRAGSSRMIIFIQMRASAALSSRSDQDSCDS